MPYLEQTASRKTSIRVSAFPPLPPRPAEGDAEAAAQYPPIYTALRKLQEGLMACLEKTDTLSSEMSTQARDGVFEDNRWRVCVCVCVCVCGVLWFGLC